MALLSVIAPHWLKNPRFRSRAVAMAIAIAAQLLLILALLIPFDTPRQKRRPTTTIMFSLPAGREDAQKTKARESGKATVSEKTTKPVLIKRVTETTRSQPTSVSSRAPPLALAGAKARTAPAKGRVVRRSIPPIGIVSPLAASSPNICPMAHRTGHGR
jgi:hypothetical protein